MKSTISALRDKLDDSRFENEGIVQELVAAGKDGSTQLENTISALRDKLESVRSEYEGKIEKMRQSTRKKVRP